MTPVTLVWLWMALGAAPDPPVEATPLGRRVPLGEGAAVFVPDGFKPGAGGTVDLVIHLHGAPTAVEPAFVQAGWRGVLVEFNRRGLSSAYTRPFSDPAPFPKLIDDALGAARRLGLADRPRAGRVVVSSFSAGFGGVRELLKVPEHFDRIDGLVLADSLYCGYAGDPAAKRLDPGLMAGFRRFAAEAAAGRKAMLVSHSAQVPAGYASTTETADDLIRDARAVAGPTEPPWPGGWSPTRQARRGRLLVVGFGGTEGDAHMAHLRRIGRLWSRYREIERDGS